MQILAIETSTDACSVALYRHGEVLALEQVIPKKHTQCLLPMVAQLLANAETSLSACQAIAFGRGPGSFTGLRIAAGVAQGLAFGIDVPIIPISTLAAIAWQTQKLYPKLRYLATLDARMKELYWAVFDSEQHIQNDGVAEQLTSYDALVTYIQSQEPLLLCGPGWSAYAPFPSPFNCAPSSWPSAISVAELAAFQFEAGKCLHAAEGLPVYVRNDVARVKGG